MDENRDESNFVSQMRDLLLLQLIDVNRSRFSKIVKCACLGMLQ